MGVLADDNRIPMMYNKYGTIIVMTHVLLPFMVLPLYSVMRVIPPYAAPRGCAGGDLLDHLPPHLPAADPAGDAAGSLLVFILAVGYYITPALVGGADGTLISNLISFHMNKVNWSRGRARRDPPCPRPDPLLAL